MKKKNLYIAGAAVGAAALGVGFFAGRALADGIPATGALTYSGVLENASGPLSGNHNIQVNFWTAASGGTTAACNTPSTAVALDSGRFSVALPDTCTDVVRVNKDTWAEVLVDGASLGRTKLGAVPYAVEAGHSTTTDTAGKADNADKLGGNAPSAYAAASHSHSFSSLTGVPAGFSDGVDNDTTYSAGTGLSLASTTFSADTNYLQRRSATMSTQCNGANSSIKAIAADGTVTCEADDNTSYSAGSGILLNGTTFSTKTAYTPWGNPASGGTVQPPADTQIREVAFTYVFTPNGSGQADIPLPFTGGVLSATGVWGDSTCISNFVLRVDTASSMRFISSPACTNQVRINIIALGW